MRNSLEDLNGYLFEQLERLNDEDVDIDTEAKRAQAINSVARQVLESGRLALDGAKLVAEYNGIDNTKLPKMLANSDDKF